MRDVKDYKRIFFTLFGMVLLELFFPKVIPAQESVPARDLKPIEVQGKPQAPEFRDIAEWINSSPLTMANLKGKVVVVHFMAFG